MADPQKETKTDMTKAERQGTVPPPARKTTTTSTSEKDWESIQHPGTIPSSGDPYGTRPVSELTPPETVSDKADLAAIRMMEKEKADRERIMTTATMEAAAARAAMTPKEMAPAGTQGQHWRGEPWAKNPKVGGKETAEAEAEAARGRMMTEPGAAGAVAMTPAEIEAERERTKAGAALAGAAVVTGAAAKQAASEAERERRMKTGAVAAGAAASRTSPETPPTRPMAVKTMTGVVPPGTETVTPVKPYGTADERARMHAEDSSVHPDWETQPQINAPRDVGIQTPEGQADAARIRAGRRRSNEAREPRVERRGEDVSVPAASSARAGGVTGAVKGTASDVEKKTKETVTEVKKDVERKI